MGELDVQLTVDAGRPMLVLAGELDVTSAAALATVLTDVVERTSQGVVIDVGSLELIDSAGAGVLLGTIERLRSDRRRLVVRGARGPV